MYTIAQMFDIANEKFNLKISKENKKEIEAIKRTIRRKLEKHGVTEPPYEADEALKNEIIFSDLQDYFLKKAAATNYFLREDWKDFQKGTANPPTYNEAVINIKFDMILTLLFNMKNRDWFFNEAAFKEAYEKVLKKLDSEGRAQPGYNDTLHALNAPSDFFEAFGKINKK